jgi:FkbM family methyltransferase
VIETPPSGIAASTVLHATHHEVFAKHKPWLERCPDEYIPTFSGSLIRRDFYTGWASPSVTLLRSDGYPKVDEELFEWIDVLEAVNDAGSQFTMVELGAGFGRWVVAAACALRRIRPDAQMRLIAVEPDADHYDMLRQHFRDNGLDPDAHRLLRVAVNGTGGTANFLGGLGREWYGQAIVPVGWTDSDRPDAVVNDVPALRLQDIIADERLIDLVDMDVQGIEGDIVTTSLPVLNAKVRRLHIGTHSHGVEDLIFEALRGSGWHCCHCFRSGLEVDTPYGRISFGDGVQSWLNPRLY